MIDWIYNHLYNAMCGVFFAVIGYFTEIQGAVHVMWAALAFDLIAGILASVFKRNERFCMTKFFTAVGRAIGATVLVALLYAMDKEMSQDIAHSYNIAAWLISGFYAWSASENMDSLTGGRIFGILKSFLAKRVEANTGINLNEDTK
jgi:Bacteriophage holin family